MIHSRSLPNCLPALLLLMAMAACQTPGRKDADPLPVPSYGRVERLADMESAFVSPRNIDVWLPDGFHPDSTYPVLYMHDGQMLFDASVTWNRQEWGVDEVVQSLINRGDIPPILVVGIWNAGELRHPEYFPQAPFEMMPRWLQDSLLHYAQRDSGQPVFSQRPFSDAYLSFITKELMPLIDSLYPTRKGPENTFIMGSSMGGLISWYALSEYPGIFGSAACLSTHWPGIMPSANNPVPDYFFAYLKKRLPEPGNHRLYFDHGTGQLDSLYTPYQQRADALVRNLGYGDSDLLSLVFKDAPHNEDAWRERLHIPIMFLLGRPAEAISNHPLSQSRLTPTHMTDLTSQTLSGKEAFLSLPGGKLWYRIKGQQGKTPVIMLHGGPGISSHYLEPLTPLANDRQLVFFDQLGSGRSELQIEVQQLEVAFFVQQLESLRNHLGLNEIILYGQSWGASLALEYYFSHPAKVKAMILSSPLVSTEVWVHDTRQLISQLPEPLQQNINTHEAAKTYEHPDYQQAMQVFYEAHVARHQPWSESMLASLESMNQQIYMHMWGPSEFTVTGLLKNYDRSSDLANVKVPVLYIAGEFDEARPESVSRFAAQTPLGRFAMTPGAAHLSMHDNPEADLKSIREFLESLQ